MIAESSRFVGLTLTALLSAATIAWGQSAPTVATDDVGRNPAAQPKAAGATTAKPAGGAQPAVAPKAVQPAQSARSATSPAQPRPSAPAAQAPKAAVAPQPPGVSPFKPATTAAQGKPAQKPRAAANPAAVRPSAPRGADSRVNMRPAVYQPNPFPPVQTDPRAPDYYEPAHRTVVRPRRLPERDSYGYGFRNPGGVGRYDEYLPPTGDTSVINPAKPMRMAVSGGSNFPVSRQEQIMMRNAGTAQAGMLNSQMGMYSRPFGFGGFGYGGGMMYGYGMPF